MCDSVRVSGNLEDKPLQAVQLCHERFKKRTDVVDGRKTVVCGIFGLENLCLTIAELPCGSLVGDGEIDGVCGCSYFDFLQLAGVADIGDICVNSKCHIFAILRQRYGTISGMEKTKLEQIERSRPFSGLVSANSH